MNEGARVIFELEDVWLRIPIKSREARTLKKVLMRTVTGGIIKKTGKKTEIEALRGINCKVREGDRVALIGHNGAGKSTFLRLVSGIYFPTRGHFRSYSKIFPMIQKSFITGHELSGLQAVKGHYLLMNKKLDGFDEYLNEIKTFSGLGDFIHLPMKTYSQGMCSRLLFSLLTSGKHDCIALDEGFGDGDARFFAQAEKRLENFIENSGALILASHSDALLQKFCNRGLVFEEGRIVFDGSLTESLNFYHQKDAEYA